jgi:hypothetical protein
MRRYWQTNKPLYLRVTLWTRNGSGLNHLHECGQTRVKWSAQKQKRWNRWTTRTTTTTTKKEVSILEMFSFMLIDPEQVRNQVNYALRLSFIDFHFSSSTQIRATTTNAYIPRAYYMKSGFKCSSHSLRSEGVLRYIFGNHHLSCICVASCACVCIIESSLLFCTNLSQKRVSYLLRRAKRRTRTRCQYLYKRIKSSHTRHRTKKERRRNT